MFGCCKKEIDVPEIVSETKIHKCQKCWSRPANHVRRLDIEMVPDEYFIRRTGIEANLLSVYLANRGEKYDPENKYQFIRFPKELVLTKYDYYLCGVCFSFENYECVPWNYWTKY